MRKWVKAIMCIAAVWMLLSVPAYGSELTDYTAPDGVRYRVDFAADSVTAYCVDKKITQVTIPATINGYAVTRIDFTNCINLVSAEIPEGIRSFCFKNCGKLKSVTIPDSVTTIDAQAFYRCGSL